MKHLYIALILSGVLLSACNNDRTKIDASGTFEAVETIVSTEASGTIKMFRVEEGQILHAGQNLGYVDSVQLFLRKKQLESQIASTLSQKPDIAAQIAALQVELQSAERDRDRIANLMKADAVTQKQLDDAQSQVDMLKKQIAAQQSSLGITTETIDRQIRPLQVQIEQIDDQLVKCRIINPVDGTVLREVCRAGRNGRTGETAL